MKDALPPRSSRLLAQVLLGGAVFYVALYILLALFRMPYPFELEWMEGGSLDHVRRILSGQKLYVRPSLGFVPFIYTPLYYYCAAGLSIIVGEGFFPLRLLSFVSSLGCLTLIFLMVRRETRSIYSGALASSLFAATFGISGAWFDISRVDSLSLFLSLAAIHSLRFGASTGSAILAGLLICLSFLCKQTALITFVPIILIGLIVNRRHSILALCTTAALVGMSTILLDDIHDGWYTYYILELPAGHQIVTRRIADFWRTDMSRLTIASIVSGFYLASPVSRAQKRTVFFYSSLAMGMIGSGWLGRLHPGGYKNALFPAYAAVSILFGLGVPTILHLLRPLASHRTKANLLYVLCAVQFAVLAYNPLRQVPRKEDLAAGRMFVRMLADVKGDAFIPCHGYLATLAGKGSHAHAMALADVLRGDRGAVNALLNNEIRQAIRERRFAVIILDSPGELLEDIAACYSEQGRAFESPTVFWPVTGARRRPEFIYVPKKGSVH